MLSDLLRSLWNEFTGWVNRVIEWVEQVFAKLFEWIRNWFDALYDYIQDLLEEDDDEVVIIDNRTDVGSQIYDLIVENCPQTRSIKSYDRNGYKQAIKFDGNHNIKKVEEFGAKNVENTNTDFDRDLASDGIIRMTA